MGRAMVRDLIDQPDITEIVVADIDVNGREDYVRSLKTEGVCLYRKNNIG